MKNESSTERPPPTAAEIDEAIGRILARCIKRKKDPLPELRRLAATAAAAGAGTPLLEQQLRIWTAAAEVQAGEDRNRRLLGAGLLIVIYGLYLAIWYSVGSGIEGATPVFGGGLFVLPLIFWRATRMLLLGR